MQITRFTAADRAVSPVIGVILMVAITVILAAVIGTFVLGLGDTLGDNAPTASWSGELNDAGDNFTITHVSGESIDADRLSVTVDGSPATVTTDWSSDTVRAGSSITVEATPEAEVRLIWESSDGSNSSALRTWTA